VMDSVIVKTTLMRLDVVSVFFNFNSSSLWGMFLQEK